MPFITPKYVVSFSSEDKVQCADNLLKPESYRKWRTSSGGEDQASVVLQLEKAEQIHAIDMGNEGSTFVEVLVGDADAQVKIDFEVLLGASALMTPVEAKSWTNTNKVRFFGPSSLNKTTREKKWSRIKIVVTQNFNKSQPFGLSFIKFHSPENTGEAKQEGKKLGMFTIKDEGSSSPKPILVGSLFDKVKRDPETVPPAGGAAAVRLATSVPISPKPTGLMKLKTESDAPNARPFLSTSLKPSTPLKPSTALKPQQLAAAAERSLWSSNSNKFSPNKMEQDDPSVPKLNTSSPQPNVKTVAGSSAGDGGISNSSSKKRPSSPSAATADSTAKKPKTSSKKSDKAPVPFAEILKDVTIVMSGYQNPLRGVVRDKALEMGAKYKPDWESSATHLICAFSNTPKFTQVLGKGKIVTKRWIEDCHVEKRRVPWRDYRLDDGSSGSDSDNDRTANGAKPKKEKKKVDEKMKKEENDDEDEYAGTTDVDSDMEEESRRPGGQNDDDPDTEDELQRVNQKTNGVTKPKPQKEDESSLPPLPVLQDFFKNKQFMLFGDFEAPLRKQMKRFIIGYGGMLSAYMSSSVDFVVTSSTWDSNFDDAITENPDLNFVRPKWIKVCHQKLKLVPYQAFIVAPPMDDDDD